MERSTDIIIIVLVIVLLVVVYSNMYRQSAAPVYTQPVVYYDYNDYNDYGYGYPMHRGRHWRHGRGHGRGRRFEKMENVENDENVEHMENAGKVEHMAPLDFGTYENPYPRGACHSGNVYARSDCMVGNCNLESSISDDEYCKMQCAQDPDPMERAKCYERCMQTIC